MLQEPFIAVTRWLSDMTCFACVVFPYLPYNRLGLGGRLTAHLRRMPEELLWRPSRHRIKPQKLPKDSAIYARESFG